MRSISYKIMIFPILIVLVIASICGLVLIKYVTDTPIKQELQKAEIITYQLGSVWGNMQHVSENIIKQSHVNEYNSANIAMYEAIGSIEQLNSLVASEGVNIRVVSHNPSNLENVMDAWERQGLDTEIVKLDGSSILRYSKAIEADEEYCGSCHDVVDGNYGIFSVSMNIDEIMSQVQIIKILVFAIVTLITFLIIISVYLSTRKVVLQPLAAIHDQVIDLNSGEGDLTRTIDINTGDELGELACEFNKFLGMQRETITDIKGVGDELGSNVHSLETAVEFNTSSLTDINADMGQLTQVLNDQTKFVVEISSTIDEVANGVVSITESIADISYNSQASAREVESGEVSVNSAVNQMNRVNDQTSLVQTAISQLVHEFENIKSFITAINDISSQTNLLALNASIEAARAGEHGRGFAIVAEEVRKLAEETSTSTEEIEAIIGRINDSIVNMSETFEQTSEEIDQGVDMVTNIRQNLTDIKSSTQEIVDKVQSLSFVSQEMSARSEEVAATSQEIGAMAQESLDRVQNTDQMVEEQLKSISSLQDLSASLTDKTAVINNIAGRFKVD